MVVIRKGAPEFIGDNFWEWLLESGEFESVDYIESVTVRNSVEDAIRVLKAFRGDLEKVGKVYDL